MMPFSIMEMRAYPKIGIGPRISRIGADVREIFKLFLDPFDEFLNSRHPRYPRSNFIEASPQLRNLE